MKMTISSGSARLWLALLLLTPSWTALRGATTTVEISNFSFSPSTATVDVGDTVTWVQKDTTEHTSTSGVNGVPDGTWDSGLLSFNQTFSQTFAEAGSFPYFCQPHNFMIGRVTVRAAASLPAVTITAPTNNAALSAPATVVIEATASATGSSVTSVEFFSGTNSVGQATSAPFTTTVNLEEGTHVLTAKVTAASGATATSEPVTVTVSAATGGTRIENPIPAALAKGDTTIELETVADGLVAPLGLAAPDDGSDRLFVYDQAGLVHVIQNGTKLETPLLDVRDRLVVLGDYDERGLLGLATHTNFAQNPLVYTYTSEPSGAAADFSPVLPQGATNNHQSVIAEWRIDAANTNRLDVSSRREILRIDKPQANHNGGTLRFGPDGFLYISLGDGGDADDEGDGHVAGGNGQEKENIYGSVLRIDVDGRTSTNGQYAIPGDNPFVGQAGVDEIYAYGFRNPYSFSFDRQTGELYLADVGQNAVEEVDRVFKGANYGWPIKEGGFYFDPNGTNAGFVTTAPVRDVPADLVDPIAQYDHDEGVAIVSGYVYRGSQLPGLIGRYLAGDWGSFGQPTGRLFYLDRSQLKELRIGADGRSLGLWLRGYGQDPAGELYIFGSTNVGPHGTSGKMLKIVPAPPVELAGISRTGTNVTVNWTNGPGPFVVQSTDELSADHWDNSNFTGVSTAEVPIDQEAAFFRVASLSGNADSPFTVWMSGAAERPNAVETPASGMGILSLEGNTLHFDIRYAGLSGAGTAAHIHGPAPASGSAGVLIDLAPFNGGSFNTNGTLSGSVVLTAEQKAFLLAGRTYVNIHTPSNGGGEIRGQIAPVAFTAQVTGGAERPEPVATPATGAGTFFLVGNQLSLDLHYRDLTGAATAAHIHGPADSETAAGVLVNLQSLAVGGFGTNGTFAGTVTLAPDQLAHLVDGLTYFNIHTPAHGGGEMRGQLIPKTTALSFSASLSGAAERPNPVETPATGLGYLTLEGSRLHFHLSYSGLSGPAVAAHIHGPAKASQAAGVLIDLAPFAVGGFGTNGTIAGSVLLSDIQRSWVMQGLTYVNLHTPSNGGGEIRGQISSVLHHSILLGASERPASVHSPATGSGQFLLVGNQLTLNVTYRGLSAPATAAHIHGPADTAGAAGVLVGLETLTGGAFDTAGSFAGTLNLSPALLAAFVEGLTYVNVHDGNHPGGEIRGQIVR